MQLDFFTDAIVLQLIEINEEYKICKTLRDDE